MKSDGLTERIEALCTCFDGTSAFVTPGSLWNAFLRGPRLDDEELPTHVSAPLVESLCLTACLADGLDVESRVAVSCGPLTDDRDVLSFAVGLLSQWFAEPTRFDGAPRIALFAVRGLYTLDTARIVADARSAGMGI